MAAINLTSNSFYSGSVRSSPEEVLQAALNMEQEGADIIDLGARSTAPYRTSEVSVEEETRLLTQSVKLLRDKIRVPLSVDTTRFEPAREAFRFGVRILNDVYGFTQGEAEDLAKLVSSNNASVILAAHESSASSDRVSPMDKVTRCLQKSLRIASEAQINQSKICIDPGIGFFSDPRISNLQWNSTVIAELQKLRRFRIPICVGLSRKKFLGQLIGDKPPDERLLASLSAAAIAVYNGAHLIRTHDVKETKQAILVARAIREKGLIPDSK